MTDNDQSHQMQQQVLDAQQAQQRAAAFQQCQQMAISIFVRSIAHNIPLEVPDDEYQKLVKVAANRAQIAAVTLLRDAFGLPVDIRRSTPAEQPTE